MCSVATTNCTAISNVVNTAFFATLFARRSAGGAPPPEPIDAATEKIVRETMDSVEAAYRRSNALFAWLDGPLVNAMRSGHLILLDEMSLAEDAVLERLNSVLEPSRTLTLAEKGGAAGEEGIDEIKGHEVRMCEDPKVHYFRT